MSKDRHPWPAERLRAQFSTELAQLNAALDDEAKVNEELEGRLRKAEIQYEAGEARFADALSGYRSTLNGGEFLT